MSSGADFNDVTTCPSCDAHCEPWFTTCAKCEFPLQIGPKAALSGQFAAPLESSVSWIDLPIGDDQPAKTALLRSFLADQGFEFEESRRFISIRLEDARAIEAAISIWAYRDEMPEDHRQLDSLMSTLGELGDAAIGAIRAATLTAAGDGSSELDLR